MDIDGMREQRAPFDELEASVVRLSLAHPGELHEDAVDALRYVIRFAKLQLVRNAQGDDVDVREALGPHAARVKMLLGPHLHGEPSLWGAMRVMPELVRDTRAWRRRLVEHFPLDAENLEEEVTTRPFVVALSGGGGSGYGYAGAWTLFHRRGLQPSLIAGTSIGALMSLFRARRKVFDGAPLIAAARRLTWERVFRVLQTESRYGLPATLRLYLRAAIGHIFQSPEGTPLRFCDLEIPLLIVTTGIGVDALKHDLSWYEHFLDDAMGQTRRSRFSMVQKVGQVADIFRELLQSPDALREVVFGQDPATYEADILDAAGFSSAIPGLIHYDVLRDDKRMKTLLDDLYARYGITRLAEGGIVNNLPARPAWAEVMSGRIRRRDAFVVALDCFAPRLRNPLFYAVQQIVRPNVQRNAAFANVYFPMQRVLSPLNLVPEVSDVTRAMKWTMDELEATMPFIEKHCTPIRSLHP